MQIYSDYAISFYGEREDIKNILPIIEETLGCEVSGAPDVIEIEESYKLSTVDEITECLAVKIARKAPNLTFTIVGRVDASASSGECMDFSIAYADGVIYEASSDWYGDEIEESVPLDNNREIKL